MLQGVQRLERILWAAVNVKDYVLKNFLKLVLILKILIRTVGFDVVIW